MKVCQNQDSLTIGFFLGTITQKTQIFFILFP
jgi:hypothetical protein